MESNAGQSKSSSPGPHMIWNGICRSPLKRFPQALRVAGEVYGMGTLFSTAVAAARNLPGHDSQLSCRMLPWLTVKSRLVINAFDE
jgi:hypothetical protein